MKFLLSLGLIIFWSAAPAATIAIIDTGFDLDHHFLRPKIFKYETDEEDVDPTLDEKLIGWNFHDNTHLKTPVTDNPNELEEILRFRSLRAKGHRDGLSAEEFAWFNSKNADRVFKEKVREFKKHAHGTFVASIALREGENINIFPIRGLHIPVPEKASGPSKAKTPQEKFNEEINNSLDRVSRKFNKICQYLSGRKIQVVNASYGITYKNIITKFRETYRQLTGAEIDEPRLQRFVDMYFEELYKRGEKTIKKYPHMLFVFSAGNSGLNNDQFHHYPSKIKLPNTMSVAALNGDFLATFSNYGDKSVEIAAPGVAILSIVPKVYSPGDKVIYSPASGTSMAAPYISNLAAQIVNSNGKLKPEEIKRIILETGDVKEHFKVKLISGAAVNNPRALKAALLSRDLSLDEAINLSKLDLIPMEDEVSLGLSPAVAVEKAQKKVMESIPQAVAATETEDETESKTVLPSPEASTSP